MCVACVCPRRRVRVSIRDLGPDRVISEYFRGVSGNFQTIFGAVQSSLLGCFSLCYFWVCPSDPSMQKTLARNEPRECFEVFYDEGPKAALTSVNTTFETFPDPLQELKSQSVPGSVTEDWVVRWPAA